MRKVICLSKQAILENSFLFTCPICSSKMVAVEHKSLICTNNHCFDLARTGYVNFVTRPVKTDYDKAMFSSRNIISTYGFFDPMVEEIVRIIGNRIHEANSGRMVIFDAGCGEGSHLHHIVEKIKKEHQVEVIGVGMDISKEGIKIASGKYKGHIWCVGDLTNSPFGDRAFDVILNILSPSNYAEFSRLLTDNGVLIKAVPGEDYLKELREALYHETDRETYSNERVLRLFENNFNLTESRQVYYEVPLDPDMLAHLIKMTPLSWNASEDEINKAADSIKGITADFTILCGKRREG
ncbi:MAG: methyltransferase domain-containing protein [Clostridiales bacterium]|nr:methyltransferase domain-containing protein [Clostridiales bacterium]